MRVSEISKNMFTKILLELWKYFEKICGDFSEICQAHYTLFANMSEHDE